MPDLPLLVATVLVLSVVELTKSERWRILFADAAPGYARCLRALVAGQLTNALSPLRAGEAVRLGLITAEGGALVPAAAALAAAKAIDTLCLGAIAAAVLGAAALGGAGSMAAAAMVIAVGTGLALGGRRLRPWLTANRVARRLRLVSIVDVGESLHRPRVLATVCLATALVWVAGMTANWLVLSAVGATPTVDLAARVIVVGYVLGFAPAPPGRLGVYEAGVVAALTSGGVPLPEALAAGVALHVCQLIELGGLLVITLVLSGRWRLARRAN